MLRDRLGNPISVSQGDGFEIRVEVDSCRAFFLLHMAPSPDRTQIPPEPPWRLSIAIPSHGNWCTTEPQRPP